MSLRRPPKKLDSNELWDYALKALGQRAHSAAEIRRKLSRRAADRADLEPTLRKLREYGLADDSRFSETFAQSRLQSGSFGKLRVLRDLRGKQVADSIATGAVDRAFAGTDERALIESFLQRKYRGQDLPALLKDERRLASVFRRLRTAGFNTGQILAVLKPLASSSAVTDWEDVPEEDETERVPD